jgi:leucine dehydrogenase
VINAGGIIYAWGTESLGWDPEKVEARLEGIGSTLTDIYQRADAKGITTEEAAGRLARSRLGRT